MPNVDTHIIIDKYLSGNISDSEMEAYNDLKETDPNFTQKVEQIQQANEAIHLLGLSKTSDLLNNIHKSKSKKARNLKYGLVSLSVILISTIVALVYTGKQETNKKEITDIQTSNTVNQRKALENTTLAENTETSSSNESTNPHEQKKELFKSDVESISNNEVLINNPVIEDSMNIYIKETAPDSVKTLITENHESNISDNSVEKITICPTISTLPPEVISACKNQDNGQIRLNQKSIDGGTKPYSIAILSTNDSQTEYKFNSLPSGTYNAIITDSKNCSKELKDIVVPEKNCPKNIELRFSPRYGESLSCPDLQTDYTLFIHNQSNVTIHQVSVDTYHQKQWDGHLQNGELIPSGLYIIELKVGDEIIGVGTLTVI